MNRFAVSILVLAILAIHLVDSRSHRGRHGRRHHRPRYEDDDEDDYEDDEVQDQGGRGFILNGISKMFSRSPNEKLATEEVNNLVAFHADNIIRRGSLDVGDVEKPQVEALTYMKIEDDGFDIFIVNVVIEHKYFVHVKIGIPHGEVVDVSRSRLVMVIPGKSETDRLDFNEFN